jgi:hypothetical protein
MTLPSKSQKVTRRSHVNALSICLLKSTKVWPLNCESTGYMMTRIIMRRLQVRDELFKRNDLAKTSIR